MRSTNFGAVDSAIASGFEDCEIFCISRFEDQAIDRLLSFFVSSDRDGVALGFAFRDSIVALVDRYLRCMAQLTGTNLSHSSNDNYKWQGVHAEYRPTSQSSDPARVAIHEGQLLTCDAAESLGVSATPPSRDRCDRVYPWYGIKKGKTRKVIGLGWNTSTVNEFLNCNALKYICHIDVLNLQYHPRDSLIVKPPLPPISLRPGVAHRTPA